MNVADKNLKSASEERDQTTIPHPAFAEAFRFWVKLGFISFGGPAGQISIMHHELVDRKKWVSNARFLNALNYFTFLPCFLFIFLGGPYIEKFRENATLSAALSSITAAVVGVVLNLAVWFGLQVLVPAAGGFSWFAAVIGLAAFASIQWFKVGIVAVIAAAGVIGFIWYQLIL